MTHYDLKAAMEALYDGNPSPVIAIAMRARFAADEGRYCECDSPEVLGLDLMCGACLLNNKDQERARVRSIAHAHEFVPDADLMGGAFCKACVRLEDDSRHHGVDAVGRTSWGEEV